MAELTDSWLVFVVVVGFAWQIIGPRELLSYLSSPQSDASTYVYEHSKSICEWVPPDRVYYDHGSNDHLLLKNARVIDGNGSYIGLKHIHIVDGKFHSIIDEKGLGQGSGSVDWHYQGARVEDLSGRYVTPGLIDPYGIDQDGVTTRIVYRDGYGHAVKNGRVIQEKGWVQWPTDVEVYEQARQLWAVQSIWCEKKEYTQELVPEKVGWQHLIDMFRGAKPVNCSIGGRDMLFQTQLMYYREQSQQEQALSSITGDMAGYLGIKDIGYIRSHYDADLVVWDRFPLEFGAAPEQVYVDGAPQMATALKPALVYDFSPKKKRRHGKIPQDVVLTGIRESHVSYPTAALFRPQDRFQLVLQNQRVVCFGLDCRRYFDDLPQVELDEGYLLPGAAVIGEYGLVQEENPVVAAPAIPARASDALVYDMDAYSHGVLYIISIPHETQEFFRGYSACYKTDGTMINDKVALHVSIEEPSPLKMAWVRQFNEPVVVHTHNQHVMRHLIKLKQEMGMAIVILGGGEAHHVGVQLAKAEIPVILTQLDNVYTLHKFGVKLAYTTSPDEIHARAGTITMLPPNQVLDMISFNLLDMFNITMDNDIVVTDRFGLRVQSRIETIVDSVK